MSSNFPPGVTGNEPQIAGYPETPETALADVLSDERVYGGFDNDEVTGWNVDKAAASLIRRLADRGVALVDYDTLYKALPEHVEGHRVWKTPLTDTIMDNLGVVKGDG